MTTISIASDCAITLTATLFGQLAYNSVAHSTQDLDVTAGVGLLACAIHVLISHAWGQYRLSSLTMPLRHLRRSLMVACIVATSLTAVLFLLKAASDYSRGALVCFLCFDCVGLTGGRLGQGALLRRSMTRGAIAGHPVVLIGDGKEITKLSSTALLFQFGQREVGRILLCDEEEDIARARDAIELARRNGAEGFVLSLEWSDVSRLDKLGKALRTSPLPVRLLPDQRTRALLVRHSRDAMARMIVTLQREPMMPLERGIKRVFDLVVSALALVVLSPLFVLIALAIRVDSPGPAIFRQHRRGFNQNPFTIFKFRTMKVQENGASVLQATRGDHRVTRLGRLLRRSSIDELPQLLNVLQGTMSLVGPRPHAIAHDDHYGQRIDIYCMRHHMKPGITGWAQVKGVRGETARIEEMQARVELDVWYINNWSPLLDLVIIMRTCFAVFRQDVY